MTTQSLTITRLRKLENAQRLPALATLFVILAVQVTKWSIKHRTRGHLRTLDDRMLNDVGISPSDARREADKAFWQR